MRAHKFDKLAEKFNAIDSSGTSEPTLRGLVRVTAPEVFMNEVVAPAVAGATAAHPEVLCELISVTRPTPLHGPSADLDIGVTSSHSKRVTTKRLLDYRLGLYASEEYLKRRDPIHTRADLRGHLLVYYVESMQHVGDLDLVDDIFPHRRGLLGATNVLAQVALVRSGAGVGLLPTYLAEKHDLRPVLADEVGADLTYWMSARPSNLRRAEVVAIADEIAHHARRLANSR